MTDSLLTVTAHLAEAYGSDHRVHLDALLGWALAPDRRIDARTPLDALEQLRLPLGSIDGVWLASATLPPLGDVIALQWLAWGHRRQVRSYIRSVTAIDRGSRQAGAAEVERWTIEAIDGHPAACLVRDGIAVRQMPESWVDDDAELILGAARPPYWHPQRREEVCAVGSAVRLQHWVLSALDELAGETRGAHRPKVVHPARARTIMATDAEWSEIVRRAEEAGVSASSFIRNQCLGGGHRSMNIDDNKTTRDIVYEALCGLIQEHGGFPPTLDGPRRLVREAYDRLKDKNFAKYPFVAELLLAAHAERMEREPLTP